MPGGAIPFYPVQLRQATVEEYCVSLRNAKQNGFWWYQFAAPLFGRYSRPFKHQGHWWFQVRPGLCWSAEGTTCIDAGIRPPIAKSYLGYQVPHDAQGSNSSLVFNVIEELQSYSEADLHESKPRAIKKAYNATVVDNMCEMSSKDMAEACDVWNSLVTRTKWKKLLQHKQFEESWEELGQLPGTSILSCRDKSSGRMIGWMICKTIGNTAYVDTIASHTDGLAMRPNDILLYSFLRSAQRNSGVTIAHYSLKSFVTTLETFKQSMGFKPIAFPCFTVLRPIVKQLLPLLYPRAYRRMYGTGM